MLNKFLTISNYLFQNHLNSRIFLISKYLFQSQNSELKLLQKLIINLYKLPKNFKMPRQPLFKTASDSLCNQPTSPTTAQTSQTMTPSYKHNLASNFISPGPRLVTHISSHLSLVASVAIFYFLSSYVSDVIINS